MSIFTKSAELKKHPKILNKILYTTYVKYLIALFLFKIKMYINHFTKFKGLSNIFQKYLCCYCLKSNGQI